ncbi:MAG: GFA family protein [Oleiphilaceae bacterium]|nr:GFA family protein [Oleiphilaceae bacterium]
MHQGSCLCGTVKYQISCEPEVVGNCHCNMCKKQHGAAFVTYVSINKKFFEYTQGRDKLTSYNSSGSIHRKFCSVCGSNMEWSGSKTYPDWVSVPLTTFDTKFTPAKVQDYYRESTCQ